MLENEPPEIDTESGTTETISTNDVFFTLSNERRRYAMAYLREQGRKVTTREVVLAVATSERGVPEAELTYDQRKSVYASLRQTHFPKMDRLGIVDFDSDAGTIELVDGVADFDFYYEPVRPSDVAWGEFILGLTGLWALVVGATATGLFPSGLLSTAVLPWFVLASFAIAGGIQTYVTRRRKIHTGFL